MANARLLLALTLLLGVGPVVGCVADPVRPSSSSPGATAADVLCAWTWDGVGADTSPSVALRADRTLEGHDGCNPMSGTWSDGDAGVVQVDELAASSYASCTEDGEQTAVQRLHDTRSLVLAGDRLEAQDARGRTIATLTREGG